MSKYPPEIRNYLHFSSFSQNHTSGDWALIMPPYYASLFQEQELDLYERCIGWRQSHNAGTLYTFFKQIDQEDIKRIRNFLSDYSNFMLVGPSNWINEHFHEELDACIAVDKNFKTLTERTKVGEHFYQAKYHDSKDDFIALADYLIDAVYCADHFRTSEQAYISSIPFGQNKTFDLPQKLTKYLVPQLENDFFGVADPILQSCLKAPKPAMKNASLEQKFDFWRKIVDNQGIDISQSVKGKTVFIIDDLYQSGVTLWSYARFLKMMTADKVIGIVCVKAGKDTDNTSTDPNNDLDDS